MNKFRGVIMIILALWCGYISYTNWGTDKARMAAVVGIVAFGVGIWRMTRKPPVPLA